MATTAVTPTPDPSKGIGDFARIAGVLFSPKDAFADIARRPSWVAPLVLLSLIWFGLCFVLVQKADWLGFTKQQIEKNKFAASRIEQLKDADRDRVYEQGARRSQMVQYARGVIGWPLLIVFAAGLYFGAFKLIAGARVSFANALAISAFGHIPMGLREVIAIPVNWFKESSAIDPQNFLASNPAAFLPESAPAWQMIPLASLDVFALWALVLIAVGFSAVDPKKVPMGKALGIAFGTSFSLILVLTAIAWVFS